ncbi:MAG: twin-arginine translocase subunit TatC [Halobacteriaceae archaeon]
MGDGDETGTPEANGDSDDAAGRDGDDVPEPETPDGTASSASDDDAEDADAPEAKADDDGDEDDAPGENDATDDAEEGAPEGESDDADSDADDAESEDDGPNLFPEHPLDDAVEAEYAGDGRAGAGGENDDGEASGGANADFDSADTVTGDPDHDLAQPADDGDSGGGPREDQELPLTAHIEELLQRTLVVMVVVSVVSVAAFPFGEEIINLLWESSLPGVETRPRLYSPLELVITQIKVASLAGVVVALPVLVYQSYRFMRPGLYPHERRYYLAAVPTSLVLAFVGLVFGYFVMLPTIFTYFYSYSKDVAAIAFALGRTFDLILVLLGALAIIFQIPLFIMLALMMGLVTREWLAQRRLLFWGSFLGVSMLFSPDPTGMAPFILTATMIGLFEGTLQLAKWTRRGRERLARA